MEEKEITKEELQTQIRALASEIEKLRIENDALILQIKILKYQENQNAKK